MPGPVYGSGLYGSGVYGGPPLGARKPGSRVGTDFELSLNGIGMKLVRGKKSYDKHNAQTFSYNPKSLFKTGDAAALNARDLYYWNRLEHSKWDGGETFEAWSPDPNDPGRLNHKYATSFGFNTIDNPHKLTMLRELYTSPSYPFVIGQDSPIYFYTYGDRSGATQAYDSINPTIAGIASSKGIQFGLIPGPIARDTTTVVGFDGLSGAVVSQSAVPFAGLVSPVNNWSIEAWVKPQALPQTATIYAAVGATTATGGTYPNQVIADGANHYWRLNDTIQTAPHGLPIPPNPPYTRSVQDLGSVPVLLANYDDDTANVSNVLINQPSLLPGGGGASYFYNGSVTGTGLVRPITANRQGQSNEDLPSIVISQPTDTWSIECFFKATSLVGTIGSSNILPNQGSVVVQALIGFGEGVLFLNSNPAHARYGGLYYWTGNNINGDVVDSGFTVVQGTTYHVVLTCTASGVAGFNIVRFYVNGALIFTSPQIQTRPGPDMSIGSRAAAGGGYACGFAGNIAEVAVYGAVLSAAQVSNHYSLSQSAGWGFGMAVGGVAAGVGISGSKLLGAFPPGRFVDSTYTFPAAGVWYHTVMTRDATTTRFYVNGALVGSDVTITPISGVSFVSAGAEDNVDALNNPITPSNFFQGSVAYHAGYAAALSAARVLVHYQQGVPGNPQLTAGQGYARFIETFDGVFYINQANTNIIYSTDGGNSWTSIALPGADVGTINALFLKGTQLYVATAGNLYVGNSAGFVKVNTGANPNIVGVNAGIYYSGQIYVGIGTTFNYIDPATGIVTLLFDTKDFTISFIEAFGSKLWFGGTNGRFSRLYTWTNNTLPPSPANGVGVQIQDGTVPYGFVIRSSLVYLNTLILGGTVALDTVNEGQGALFAITAQGAFSQLAVIGPPAITIKGTGLDYGPKSLWGADNAIWIAFSHRVGIARYDFSHGSFSTDIITSAYPKSATNVVLAVARFLGRSFFAVKNDGQIWKEAIYKVSEGLLEETDFIELPFLPKLIDGIEGQHTTLKTDEAVVLDLSFDGGLTWNQQGINAVVGTDHFEFNLTGVRSNRWKSRLHALRGFDRTTGIEINNWSVRFAPQNSPKHEWLIEVQFPTIQQTLTGAIITDAGAKLLDQLWHAREDGIVVDFIDRDRRRYKVLVIEMHETELNLKPVRIHAQQLQLSVIFQFELLEVQRVS
jgi:hypothetical protein